MLSDFEHLAIGRLWGLGYIAVGGWHEDGDTLKKVSSHPQRQDQLEGRLLE